MRTAELLTRNQALRTVRFGLHLREFLADVRSVVFALDDRHEMRFDFLVQQLLPVNVVEPGMVSNFSGGLGAKSQFRLLLKQALEQVLQFLTDLHLQ